MELPVCRPDVKPWLFETAKETLRKHALRNGFQRSGRRSIDKMHGNEGFNQVLKESDVVLAFPKTKFCLEQRKIKLKTGKRVCGTSYWVQLPHNMDFLFRLKAYHQTITIISLIIRIVGCICVSS
jgi:hypothetical protein